MVVRWIYLQMEPFVYVLLDLHHYLVFVVAVAVMGRHAINEIDHFPFWVAALSLAHQTAMHLM